MAPALRTRSAALGRVDGDHLEVLGRPLVDDLESLVEVVDEARRHSASTAPSRPARGAGWSCTWRPSSASTASSRSAAVGDEQARGVLVVLGLRDQVGGQVAGVGPGVGEDADLGRAGLGVDPDDSLEEPLGRSHVDVARAGHEVDPRTVLGAVGEHRHGLRPTDGVHLVDAQQAARRQDRRVRQPAVLTLRWRRDRDRARPRPPAPGRRSSPRCSGRRPDPPGTYRPTRPTGTHFSVTVPPGTTSTVTSSRTLRLVHASGAVDGLLERGPEGGVERRRGRPGSPGAGTLRRLEVDPVEAGGELAHGDGARAGARRRRSGRTCSTAASTLSAARGSTSRGSTDGAR